MMMLIAETAMTMATAAGVDKAKTSADNHHRRGGGSGRGVRTMPASDGAVHLKRTNCRVGGGGEDNAAGGGSGPMTPFDLERTKCCVSSLSSSSSSSSGAGRALTQEVLLRASFVVALSSESATPATAPINDGVQSAATSTNREKLARAEQRIWGNNLDALGPPMSWHPPPPG